VSIEPSIADLVDSTSVLTDWSAYRKCPICGALSGAACEAMYARIVEGRQEGGPAVLRIAHGARRWKSGR
jgi:hypothetical protein